MTSPARQREADRATAAFQIVLAQMGIETLSDLLVLWDEVPQSDRPAMVQAWTDRAVELVLSRRTLTVQLARAYYRLARALKTGKTVADPNTPEPKYITLSKLRSEFDSLVEPRLTEQARQHLGDQPSQQGSRNRAQPQRGSADDEADRILVEEIKHLREKEAADAQAADDEARILIEQLGPKHRDSLLRSIDNSQPADEVDHLRAEAHDKAGARQAAAGERIAMNGGRSTLWNLQESDPVCLGWIRVSLSGTPCGWCAMLISRGVVYKSKASATYADGDTYHDNCHCVAVQVFSTDEYKNSPSYELNRHYEQLWPWVTRGYQGKAAIAVWRRYIRAQQKAQAQVAKPLRSPRRRE